jgi:ATP-dependent DNA helicase RecQ
VALSLEFFKNGQSVSEIAKSRGLAETTVEGHLSQAIENGEKLDPRALFTETEEQLMRDALRGYDEPALKPIFEQLGGHISYGKLKFFRAMIARNEISN